MKDVQPQDLGRIVWTGAMASRVDELSIQSFPAPPSS